MNDEVRCKDCIGFTYDLVLFLSVIGLFIFLTYRLFKKDLGYFAEFVWIMLVILFCIMITDRLDR